MTLLYCADGAAEKRHSKSKFFGIGLSDSDFGRAWIVTNTYVYIFIMYFVKWTYSNPLLSRDINMDYKVTPTEIIFQSKQHVLITSPPHDHNHHIATWIIFRPGRGGRKGWVV